MKSQNRVLQEELLDSSEKKNKSITLNLKG